MVEARINNRTFGKEFARLIATCREPDTIAGLQNKAVAMERFTQKTGVDKDFVGRIRSSVINTEDFREVTIRPLLSALELE